jgi:hypothetical protein
MAGKIVSAVSSAVTLGVLGLQSKQLEVQLAYLALASKQKTAERCRIHNLHPVHRRGTSGNKVLSEDFLTLLLTLLICLA